MVNEYQLLKHLPLRRLNLIWLWTTPWSAKSVNCPDCSTVSSSKFYWDYIFPQIQELWSADPAGVMNQVVCLCSFWSNVFAVNAPLELSSCISIVLSMLMLSNKTNTSPCYIFLGAFICACLYLGGGGRGVLWHLSPCWYVSECVRAYGPFLFIFERVRYTEC